MVVEQHACSEQPWSFYAWVALACRVGDFEMLRDALVALRWACDTPDDDAQPVALRRAVAEALVHHVPDAWRGPLGEAREADLRRLLADHTLPDDDAAWSLPVWLEGLALLRLATRDGLQTDACARGVPLVCRPRIQDQIDAWA